MIASEQKRFDDLYEQHLRALKLQGVYATQNPLLFAAV